MIPGLEQQAISLKNFYEGTIRVALVIFKDYPDFFGSPCALRASCAGADDARRW